MLNISDIKPGVIIDWKGAPHEVVFAQHSKLGRGGAILRCKLKNLTNGAIIENTFKGADKVEPADLTSRQAQYLYKDNANYVFMDNETYEQFELPQSTIGDAARFLKEEMKVDLVYINGKPANVRLPIKAELEVTYTEPGFRGDTQSTAMKPATLETGTQIQVPLFINNHDLVRVDTRTGTYVERA